MNASIEMLNFYSLKVFCLATVKIFRNLKRQKNYQSTSYRVHTVIENLEKP